MKEIRAYINKHKLSDVVWALHKIDGLTGLTMIDVFGYGRDKAKEASKEKKILSSVECMPKIKLELICEDSLAGRVVQAIQKAAHTGLKGDGKIYIYNVIDAVRISTNEQGNKAI